MKAIINGVRFDTAKATELAFDSYGNTGDFHHWIESLFKTPRSGRYFLAGSGGAMSRYASTLGQGQWCGDEKITPLDSEAAAFSWAQDHMGADEIEEHFGHLVEDA